LAQDRPIVELSGGYQYMFDVTDVEQFPKGWVVSVGWNATDSLALVGEFAHSAKVCCGVRLRDVNVYSTMGGVRIGSGFFGQVLIGQLAIRTKEDQVLGILTETQTEIAFQAGGGFRFGVTNRVSIVVTGDYRQPFSNTEDFARQIRGAASIVVGIGNR
jgi:hypothetical protein